MYRSKKINCMPISKKDGKGIKSKWKKYQTEICLQPIPEDYNFGVICGETSDNLIVLDLDHTRDINLLNEITSSTNLLNNTLVVRSGQGFHVYLRIRGKLPNTTTIYHKTIKNSLNDPQSLEIKSQGNYVMGASSDHYIKGEDVLYPPSGKKYEIISDVKSIWELTITKEEDLLTELSKHGWEKDSKQVTLDIEEQTDDKYTRLKKGGWQSGNRHNNGFWLAIYEHTNNKSYDEIKTQALEINQTNTPPSAEHEVERWVREGIKQSEKNEEENNAIYKSMKRQQENTDKKEKLEKTTELICNKFTFATYTDTEELMVWNGKYYNTIGAEFTVKEAVDQESKGADISFVNNVLAKIKRSTGRPRENFNKTVQIVNGIEEPIYDCTLENGILNLDTLEFREHSHQNYTTWNIPVNWDENRFIEDPTDFDAVEKTLDGTVFWKYLKECFQENSDAPVMQEDVFTVMESMAYILHSDNDIQKTIMFIGSGSNGKSKLLDYIDELFGKRNTTHISIQELAEGGFVLAQLDGKLANICADVESTELKRTGKLKQLIGGEGIEVSKKYQNPYTMRSRSKFIFSANKFPYSYDQSDGFFRRYIILQWKRKFDGENKDTELGRKLRENEAEKSLVFHVLVKMARNLRLRGDFLYTKPVNEVRTNWNNLADPIQMFVNEKLEDVAGAFVSKRDMFQAYKQFCIDNEMQPLRIGSFGKIFREMYDDSTLREGQQVGKVWNDVKIKPDPVKQGRVDDEY